jgi:hypothetical protein
MNRKPLAPDMQTLFSRYDLRLHLTGNVDSPRLPQHALQSQLELFGELLN